MNTVDYFLAAARCGNSSKVTYRRLARPGCFRRKVVFPVWRNPVMTTTGISSRAENTVGAYLSAPLHFASAKREHKKHIFLLQRWK